ncbi:protein kinase domain-containing protein [Deinococcus hopiensis]|uniref:Protein kinase domain-containing protein n=1 Tax=Deinococcus hopiensis KR-140 TaxID=695939 RepID=A0A1W1UEK5_9DEIO|nr:protein kinase [Deinococcus hopiensis]SMB79231.1 Protein kinase domain-containing protein [Deinococcus hopiensis KR-140]
MTTPDAPSTPPLVWTPPGQVELVRTLGGGWLGEVHEARESSSGRQVALRLIAPERIAQLGQIVDLLGPSARQEGAHRLPVTLPQAEGGHLFYTMALAEGGSLRSWLDAARTADAALSVDLLLDLLTQVARGLAEAHAGGQVHGNLKPENVLLHPHEGGMHVWLSDFGWSALRPSEAANPYLSPEQRAGRPAESQADLHAAGVMLCGGLQELLGQKVDLPPSPERLAALPAALRDVIRSCVSGEFSGADALAAQLAEVRTYIGRVGLGPVAEPAALRLMLGESRGVQLHPGAVGEGRALRVAVGGVPSEWVSLPAQAQADGPLAVRVAVPRTASVKPGTHTAEFRFLAASSDSARHHGAEELARLTLPLEVLPFEQGYLELMAKPGRSGGTVALHLANRGDVPEHYRLDYTLPTGSRWVGQPPPRELDLPPGGEYRTTFAVRCPPVWGPARPRRVLVFAQGRPWGSPEGRTRPLEARATFLQRPALPLWAGLPALAAVLAGLGSLALPPRIAAFNASDTQPGEGVPFALRWQVPGARTVRIRELPGRRLPAQGQLRVPGVDQPQTYTLVAQGRLTSASRQITVWPVREAPQIVRFDVTPRNAPVGSRVRVTWRVAHAAHVTLAPFGDVPAEGTRTLPLTRSTAFELTAGDPVAEDLDGRGVLQRSIRATLAAPRIERFRAEPPVVVRGQPVTLRWQVRSARTVRLAPLGNLPASGERTFVPTESGPLVLKASSGEQEVLARAEVHVHAPPPRITAFEVLASAPVPGQPLPLRWNTAGSVGVKLRWNGGSRTLPPQGKLGLSVPPTVKRLTLVARNAEGQGVEQVRTLKWAVPPAITLTQPAPPSAPPPTTRPAPHPERVSAVAKPAPTPPQAQTSAQVQTSPKAQLPRQVSASPPAPASPAPARSAPQPRILSFRAAPAALQAGESTTLRWQVSGTGRVRIPGLRGPQDGLFPAQGSVTLRPTGDQTYVLVAGKQRAEVRVRVQTAQPAPTAPVRAPAPTAQVRPPAATAPVRAPAATAQVRAFSALPATLNPGERAVLTWDVGGVSKVFLAGLSGPNPDGSFPPQGRVQTLAARGDQVFVLSAGGKRTTLTVPLVPLVQRGPAPSTEPAPAPVRPPAQPAQEDITPASPVEGTWQHTFGTLRLEVQGRHVRGVLASDRTGFPGGTIRGTLSGSAPVLTLNGRVTQGEVATAFLLRFDTTSQTFTGFAAQRGERGRWCGWRMGADPPGCGE